MAVEDHLKIAASEIQRAVESLKTEISQLRSDETRVKQTIALQLTQMAEQVKLTQQQINTAADTNHSSQLRTLVSQLQGQINDKKHEMDEELRRISDMIRDKENSINVLQQQARSVSP